MDNLTTRNVPRQFLSDVFLVGLVPRRVLASDSRISYALYIPAQFYNPDPSNPGRFDPSDPDSWAYKLPKLRLLVYIHGTRREADIDQELQDFADLTPCAILAPLFPVGLDGPFDLDSYKMLRSKTVKSDLALLSMLDEIAHIWPGIETETIFMMGFSGGGQFTHRFLYLYPERLAAVSIGAPGRTTALDDKGRWPLGISDVETVFGKAIRMELIAQVHIQLIVGSDDNVIHGSRELWDWLDQLRAKQKKAEPDAKDTQPDLPPRMERGRLENLQLIQKAWMECGIDAKLEIVQDVAHSSIEVREEVLQFLQPLMTRA